MAARKKAKNNNLKPLPGHPGLYTPITVTRNPRKEKALWAKILRDARKLTNERLAREALLLPRR